MRLYVLILSLVFTVSASKAQTTKATIPKIIAPASSPAEPCRLKLSNLPSVRGLRLDMPKAEVQKEYPLMNITADPVKSIGTALSHQISNPDYQDNLDRLTIMFRNEKVFSILLTYSDLIVWDSMEEFADKISKSFNLPKAIQRKRGSGIYYSVNCGEFLVRTRINADKQPTLLITKDPQELWESTEQQKDAFKP